MIFFKMADIPKMLFPAADALCVAFSGGEIILLKKNGAYRLPELQELVLSAAVEMLRIGTVGKRDCCALEMESGEIPENCETVGFRNALRLLDAWEQAAANRARQMLYWEREHRFCGHCGNSTEFSTNETARVCPACGARFYPRIMPAVIIAISKGDEILLAHNHKFKEGLYSLIAGFVEAGESLEEAVAREIYEEVHIKVRNIKYFDSQSWPFPQSLMLGFTAEYAAGEIIADGREIIDAKWFTVDNLPLLPSGDSISRRLIDDFIDSCRE